MFGDMDNAWIRDVGLIEMLITSHDIDAWSQLCDLQYHRHPDHKPGVQNNAAPSQW